jgi:hypothetical protein
VDRLLTADDLRPVDVADVVRLALVVHDRPSLVARALEGSIVGVVLPPPRTTSAKARLHAAIRRLGAEPLVVEPRGRGLPPPIDDVVDQLQVAVVRVCVVAGTSTAAIRQVSEHLAVPTFNASQRPDDPWPVLAGAVAERLCAAHRERGAVDGFEEMVREAMVPTAAAVIALLAGAAVPTRSARPIDLRTETASHWFG